MQPLYYYWMPVMHQFIKLDELIELTNFHGAEFLIGEVNGLRVQPVTCYKFKMDWIIFRLVQFAKCVLLAECSLINDGLIDHHNVDELLDLFVPTFSVYDATVIAIKNIEFLCDQDEIYEEARILKIQEIRQQEANVTRMLRNCKAATKTLVDELKVFVAQLDLD